MMIDQLYDRNYQFAREAMNQSIDRTLARLWAELRDGFETLNRIQYSAPWKSRPRKTCTC